MRLSFLLLLVAALAGCKTLPEPANPATERPDLAGQTPFSVSGRIAVKHEDKRDSTNLYWAHTSQGDEITLLGPLGRTVARITRNAGGAALDTSDAHYEAGSIEELTQKVFGWQLPLDGLIYWVMALPDPSRESEIEMGENGQIAALRQDGWNIHYLRYLSSAPNSLPQRLSMTRDGLDILLLVDTWDIPH